MDESIDWVGCFTSVHNLLPIVYGIWYQRITGKKPPKRQDGPTAGVDADFACILDAQRIVGEGPDEDDMNPGLMADDEQPAAAHAAADAQPGVANASSPEDNIKDRKTAMAFVSVPSLAAVVVGLRLIITPMFNFMHKSLDMGGARWDRLQYAKSAQQQPREYRGWNAATCKLETQALSDLKSIAYDASRWEVIGLSFRTVAFRNNQFQAVSTFACGISNKHTDVHTNYPAAAFLWLYSPDGLQAEYDKVSCKHLFDPFVETFCSYWVTRGGLDQRGARADLESLMILFQEDMAEIEARHASIRRELTVLSTQTHSTDFLELSDRHVLRCTRRQPASYGVQAVAEVVTKCSPPSSTTESAQQPTAEPTKIHRRTHAWNVYVSEHSRGSQKGAAQTGFSAGYHAMDATEKEGIDKIADNKADAIRLGARAFTTKRDIEASSKRQKLMALTDAVRQGGEIDPTTTSAATELANLRLDENNDFDEGIRTIKRGLRGVTKADAAALALQDDVQLFNILVTLEPKHDIHLKTQTEKYV